jgi:glycosyltransferase involved in cell wall biosynthesis
LFSIIIPLYNKSEYICRAIDSVLAQKFQEFEIIVINDGSTDGGDLTVRKKYESHVIVVDQANQGVSAARNTGIKIAKYPYIAFLDGDDLWDPNYLLMVNKVIKSSNNPGIIGIDYIRFKSYNDIDGRLNQNELTESEIEFKNYSIKEFFDQAILNTLIFTSAVIIKKDFFDKNQGFDSLIKFGEDLDVWYRAILSYGFLTFIPIKLVYYSREDETAATKKLYHLSQTYIPKIIKEDYFNWSSIGSKNDLDSFDNFKIKWIYLRLFPNYQLDENKEMINELIPKLKKRYFLIGWIYLLPFDFLNQLFSKNYIRKYWNKYLNYCFNNFYN